MGQLLGIDLGTSSVKAVIIDENAQILGIGSQEYIIESPQPGYAEQNPEQWWTATVDVVRQAVQRAKVAVANDATEAVATEIDAIGLAGQMHGAVLLDSEHRLLGNAIIWADQRSALEVAEFIDIVGEGQLARITGTAPFTGFMGTTLLWLQKHDPAKLDKAAAVLLPKDYLRYRLTGIIGTEATDASATALFDIRQRQWSSVIIEALDLPDALWPDVFEAADIIGTLTREAAEAFGLQPGIPVAAGCADQPAQAVGNGLLQAGAGSVTIGTGGQLFIALSKPQIDPTLKLHTFCHAPTDRWYMLGAMLSAGLSLRWLKNLCGMSGDPNAYQRLSDLASGVSIGSEGLLFQPYLIGERAPVNDPTAKGGFVSLTLQHDLRHFARAVMEGVAFNLRQILDVMVDLNAIPDQLVASGGGLSSPVWRQITADVLERPLLYSAKPERAAVGAALVAGIGISLYADYNDIQTVIGHPSEITEPNIQSASAYHDYYQRYQELYLRLHDL